MDQVVVEDDVRIAVTTHRVAFSPPEAERLRRFGFAFDEVAKKEREKRVLMKRLDVPGFIEVEDLQALLSIVREFGPVELSVNGNNPSMALVGKPKGGVKYGTRNRIELYISLQRSLPVVRSARQLLSRPHG